MHRYLIFNKPFQVLTQFTDSSGRSTLADFIDVADVYGAGRLDYDSEGLLILTNDGQLIHSMMHPKFKLPKTYYAQVEGIPDESDTLKLEKGIRLKDGMTLPCTVKVIEEPNWLWKRNPPIRDRKAIPTAWLSITITEGKNRQVRRMTAAIGFPTLRLVRSQIGSLLVNNLNPGEYKEISLETILDNGIKLISKKGNLSTASLKSKRLGSHPRRNQRFQNRNRTAGKTQPDSQ
jgi:23S rRNA pseudouridine2457 synthase